VAEDFWGFHSERIAVASKIVPLVKECHRQVENCLYTSTALFILIDRLRNIRILAAVVPLVLGSFATWNVLTESHYQWAKTVTALSAFLAGLIPSIVTAVKLDDNLDRCNLLANEFKNMQDRFRQAACFTATKGLEPFEKEFTELRDRMEELRRKSIAIPEWAFKRGQAKVSTKDYDFNIDLAELEATESKKDVTPS
jgi:hypothetical protein